MWPLRQGCWRWASYPLWRATHTGEDGFDLLTSNDGARLLWKALINAGAKPVGADALEILRIEAGIPRYGMDMDETNVVTETGLDDSVSFTKGCYIGQEILNRIHTQGHVNKQLVGLVFPPDPRLQLSYGDKLFSAEQEIGSITSSTFSPALQRPRRSFAEHRSRAPSSPAPSCAHARTREPCVRRSCNRPARSQGRTTI